MDTKVEVRGIREFQSAIKQVDSELPKELKVAFLGIATHVAGVARGRVKSVSGRAAGSIKPKATTRGAGIAFGGSAAPYFPWLDWGGSTGKGHIPGVAGSGATKRPWIGGDGRYIYPAIKDSRSAIEKGVDDAIKTVAEHAGFETKGGL